MTTEDLAYAAGFIDGEGCFYVGFRMGTKGRRCFPCTVTVSQTEPNVLAWLRDTFGGKSYPTKKPSGLGTKPVYMWSIYGAEADKLIALIYPYLRVKKQQAEVFMEMRVLINANRMGKRISPLELQKRTDLVARLRHLKSAPVAA